MNVFPDFSLSQFISLGYFVSTAFLALQLSSCGRNQDPVAIDEDKLVEVLIDIHIAEAAVQGLRGATKDSMINVYYDQVCEIHEVSREDFETSMEILRNDPKRLEDLYSRIMTEMERQEVESKEKEQEE